MAFDMNELSTMDATAQAELVRRRELTPLELVDAAITRIERVNPTLNAVITRLFEEAREAAVSPDLPDGPFSGVPFLLKDIGAMQKGQPYYMGNRALRDAGFRSPADTPLGARFRAVGLITLGKTNLPEFGLQSIAQPLAFGATHNPWALDRSTGGGPRTALPCSRNFTTGFLEERDYLKEAEISGSSRRSPLELAGARWVGTLEEAFISYLSEPVPRVRRGAAVEPQPIPQGRAPRAVQWRAALGIRGTRSGGALARPDQACITIRAGALCLIRSTRRHRHQMLARRARAAYDPN
jgi:hypothetical protein